MHESRHSPPAPTLDDVRAFWEANPLFAGESRHEPASREFFDEFERTTVFEHSGSVSRIFTRGIGPGTMVLDVGCGIGFWVGQFCRLGATVSACDLTMRAVEITRSRLKVFGLQADVRQGNAESLPYPDGAFDHVNCQGVIHHTPDPSACIREFHRVLRSGGVLCVSVYLKTLALRSRPLFKLATFLARPLVRLRGRGREGMLAVRTPQDLVRMYDGAQNPIGVAFTRAEFRGLLAGRFRVVEEMRFGLPRRAIPLRMPNSAHRILSRAFGLMIVLRCQKLDPGQMSEAA